MIRRARVSVSRRGAALFEVVLSVALFVMTAAVVYASIASSLKAVQRLRLRTTAADLAITVLSEVQMGLRDATAAGPEPFVNEFDEDDPDSQRLVGWQWEITADSVPATVSELPGMTRLTVIVTHEETGVSARMVELLPETGGEEP